ncbi:hypothetical protein MOQ72_02475 [Saccharopolyspora sp. K220]|uniref:hypothetical protein n=1 Tax=Saccharopolyspora soli TaxID=2926618 RepID=UPI001F563ED3|nr:hypothetical protein [Saccharopolyspora soli]MCI2416275.1 hypothetical protein [Saccharopolyspora soli]
MIRCTAELVAAAEQFVWLTARVLEQRLFEFLFADGGAEGVLAALDAYRCADGGYGYALEPDARGPISQPLQTYTALATLDGVGECGGATVTRICDYLMSITRPDGGVAGGDPRLRDYPHAPWMPIAEEPEGQLLTTSLLAGLLHKNRIEHPWLAGATEFCWERIDRLTETHPYEAHAAVSFLDHVPDRDRAGAVAERLGKIVREQRLVLLDPQHPEQARLSPGYAPGELHGVWDYAAEPTSLARPWFSDDEMSRGLDHLADMQEADGGWPIRWRHWAPGTRLESRPRVAIGALLTLRAYDEES